MDEVTQQNAALVEQAAAAAAALKDHTGNLRKLTGVGKIGPETARALAAIDVRPAVRPQPAAPCPNPIKPTMRREPPPAAVKADAPTVNPPATEVTRADATRYATADAGPARETC